MEKVIMSPGNMGSNSFWSVNATDDLSAFTDVIEIDVCYPKSNAGAVSFLDFCVDETPPPFPAWVPIDP